MKRGFGLCVTGWTRAAGSFAIAAALLAVAPTARAQYAYEALHGFEDPPRFPYAGLIEGSDGALYGTTYQGGVYGAGIEFRVNVARPLHLTSTVSRMASGQGPAAQPRGALEVEGDRVAEATLSLLLVATSTVGSRDFAAAGDVPLRSLSTIAVNALGHDPSLPPSSLL